MRNIQEMVTALNSHYRIALIDDEHGTLPDPTMPVMYACPVCGDLYGTVEEAAECRDQPYDDDGLKVGDIVVIPGVGHNQIASDDPWLAFEIPKDPKSASHFDRDGYMVPFFVVTAVHAKPRQEHQCVVTVASLYDGCLKIGWNPANGVGHYEIFKLNGERNQTEHNDYWVDKMGILLSQCVVSDQVWEEATALVDMKLSTRSLL